uniref:flagellar basal body P-ring protein FlgI n=1 Tax=Escherichia coli TaxID=562 RepID=UPI0013CF8EBF
MFRRLVLAVMLTAAAAMPAGANTSRIKDLVDVEGIRENQLIGYGLVVGLNGTGDTLNNSPFTRQSIQSMMERLGVNTRGMNLR